MRKVTKNKNTRNKNAVMMKIPTMLQRKNGTQGMKNGTGSKKTQKATMRKLQHVGAEDEEAET
eukprot:143068-Prorocentrum_lima.AAC.1